MTLRRLAGSGLRDHGIVFFFLALFLFLTFSSGAFFTQANFLNLLDQSAAVGLIAAANTLLLVSGGFDLSVGAIFALAGVVAGLMEPHIGVPAALVLGVLSGVVAGACNGVVATVGRINPLVATLASQIIIRGIALALTGGMLVSVADPSFKDLGTGEFLGIHYSIYLWLGFAVVCGGLLAFTRYGRHIYAVGGNPEAARLSGIRVDLVKGSAYVLSGLAAGLAGVLVASRVATGQADAGTGMELDVIAAVVIGGTSIAGGEGAVWRTVLGVLLMALIGNGFNLLSINPIYQQILQGAIILAAVGADAWARRRTTA
jgi:ribose transport system permease protein